MKISKITEKEREKKQASQKIDKFDFYLKEQKLNKQLIEEVETKISRLNSERYRLDHEINRIKKALKQKVSFNINDIQRVFEDMKVYFPRKMKKDYNDLIEFNLSVSKEISKYLHEDLEEYIEYLSSITLELKKLNQQKEKNLSFLRSTDTFREYKQNQQDLFVLEEQIIESIENAILFCNEETTINNLKNNVSKPLREIIKDE